MILSDISIRRPVLASVMNLLLIAFGLVSYFRLQVREYPDVEPPVVSIETEYPGAAASVMERRITQLIEDRIAGVEGIKTVSSVSRDGVSEISVEFTVDRDIDAAANDVREAVSSVLDQFPEEVRPPEITKQDATTEVLMWLNLTSDSMTMVDLADYADRYLLDRFSTLPGVARVRITGATRPAMRLWLDREALAARNLTVLDVEEALRRQNVELPAGAVQSLDRTLTVRLKREFVSEEEFRGLILKRGTDGYLVRLGEVAKVELGAEDARRLFRGNGVPMVGLGIVKQSRANSLAVARAAREEMVRIRDTLPEGMGMEMSYDTSVFIEASLHEVYETLAIAIGLVVLVIYLFLGNWRATLIPAVAVPVSAIATCAVMYFLDFSINVLTLLAMVLAIGLVVDDAIVVLENIHRRIESGEPPMAAAFLGARQVGFAVIATTAALIAVFVPISFLEGDVGKLFTEFAITLAVAVAFSGFVALTWGPMLASRILRPAERANPLTRAIDGLFRLLQRGYRAILRRFLGYPIGAFLFVAALGALTVWLQRTIPAEFIPMEDRGSFFVIAQSPEGGSYGQSVALFDKIEERLAYLIDSGEATRVLVRTPRAMGAVSDYNEVIVIVNLADWGRRRPALEIMDEVRKKLTDLRGVRTYAIMRQGLSRGLTKPFQIVLGGPTYEELAVWRDRLMEKARAYPGFVGLDYDYKESKPQLRVAIDRNRAADLGVSTANIGRTLEALMGSRRVTTYIDNGEEYDVLIEGDYEGKRSPADMTNVQVRSETTGRLIPLSNLVSIEEFADSGSLNRYDRMRAITFDAGLAPGYSVSEAVTYFENLIRETVPDTATIGYKGETLKFKESSGNVLFVFLLAIVVVYLVLAAQFESFVHPVTILLTVPIAIAGALLGLLFTGLNQSLFTQIGMIMLVGLAAKNGILIVEFINQLREEGRPFDEAIVEASVLRLRPILMTVLTTLMGTLPLVFPSGAGSETRFVVGVVILWGVGMSAIFTLFVVPLVYRALSRRTQDPGAAGRKLEAALARPLLAIAALFLPGCTVGPDYAKPQDASPTAFKAPAPWREIRPSDDAERGAWWRVFGDERLDELQEKAAAASPGARAAYHRVEEARAAVRVDRAALFPSVFAGVRGNKERGSDTASTFSSGSTRATVALPLDLEYELDLWGRVRRQVEATEAEAEAAAADYRGALLSLQSDLALLYFRLRTLDAERAVLDEAVAVRKKALSLVQARFNAGDVAELDVAQAETELSAARTEAIGLERERRQLENALAVLCGESPSGFRVAAVPWERALPAIPGDFPSDLLERRPDVARAERTLAAATARVGVAQAAFYPGVRVGSSLSLESRALNLLFQTGSGAWGLFGSASQPVVDGGERRGRLEGSRAALSRTAEEYRLTVLSAIREVEDALSALDVLRRQDASLAETVASARRTVAIAEKRYESGLVSYFEVVDAQRALLRSEQESVTLRGDRHAAALALVKALGGEW